MTSTVYSKGKYFYEFSTLKMNERKYRMYNHSDENGFITDFLVLLYWALKVCEYIDHFYKPMQIDLFLNIPIDHIQL